MIDKDFTAICNCKSTTWTSFCVNKSPKRIMPEAALILFQKIKNHNNNPHFTEILGIYPHLITLVRPDFL
jgi:hypothetical protein